MRRFVVVRRDVWLWRWGVRDLQSVSGRTIVETFLTRRGAERWIRANTWTEDR